MLKMVITLNTDLTQIEHTIATDTKLIKKGNQVTLFGVHINTSNTVPSGFRPKLETLIPCVLRPNWGFEEGLVSVRTDGTLLATRFNNSEYTGILDVNGVWYTE